MPTVRFGTVQTPDGRMLVAWTDRGIAVITRALETDLMSAITRRFPQAEPVATTVPRPMADWLCAGLQGDPAPLPRIDPRGLPEFDARVYAAVRRIPRGATATYGEVAAGVGAPRAARAVGNAMRRCPFFPAVPCQRVVRASDGWSGWGGDPWVKRRLLELESAR